MNRVYKMFNIDEDNCNLPCHFDFFIFAANSNMRCYNAISKLSSSDCKIDQKILFDYKKLQPNEQRDGIDAIINYEAYKSYLPCTVAECIDDDDDVQNIVKLDVSFEQSIAIDITGFTVPDIFRILYVFREIKKTSILYVFYTEPQHYVFRDDIFNKYEYLSGERTYKPVPEYFSTGSSEKELLVCFLGFDIYVSDYIYEKALPHEAVAINGFPSYLPKLKDISLLNNYSLLTTNIDNEHRFYTRADNPFSVYNTLCDIRSKFPDFLMNICVLGTKPMALGASMFSLDNKDNVKVTYPYPQQYIPQTTHSSTKAWCYVVNL